MVSQIVKSIVEDCANRDRESIQIMRALLVEELVAGWNMDWVKESLAVADYALKSLERK